MWKTNQTYSFLFMETNQTDSFLYCLESKKEANIIQYILNSNNWNCEVHSQPLNQIKKIKKSK
jgi:hypothetical protein